MLIRVPVQVDSSSLASSRSSFNVSVGVTALADKADTLPDVSTDLTKYVPSLAGTVILVEFQGTFAAMIVALSKLAPLNNGEYLTM
jgi:hypothetical protein